MAAYMIVYASIKDRERFLNDYAPVAAKLVQRFGGRYIVRAPGAEVIEGELPSGMSVVISEWADRQALLNFWNSPDYAAARKLRDGVADCQVCIVEE